MILNFLPLLLWMAGFPMITSWLCLREKLDDPKPRARMFAMTWIVGSVLWLLLGIGCSIAARLA